MTALPPFVQEMLTQAQPGDEASWCAYADWLQEQDDADARALGEALARHHSGPLGLRFAPLPAGMFWMGGGGTAGDKSVTIARSTACLRGSCIWR